MSSWFSAWLPNFNVPSINLSLPSSLQSRFISFVLKKALGHLLAPGQLDLGQIESQIGSGYVQINDLELNCEAINALLVDLPVTLHDGFISSAVAKIPWPNPLTSTLGFSLDSLHLTFHLRPKAMEEPLANVNLAESVFSVAESFIHDELTAQEGATLIQSIHGEPPSNSHHLPGSLDNDNPFKASPDENEDSEPESQEIDPSGVSVFATMIERLLARFEFDATNTRITLVHPGNMSLTVTIPSISYRGNSEGNLLAGASSTLRLQHTVSISDLTVTARNLRVASPPSSSGTWTPSRQSPRPASSSSSIDEDTQMMMSQSLACLPPRTSSPTGSVASSLYESAISDVHTSHGLQLPQASKMAGHPNVEADERSPLDQRQGDIWEEEKLLTFGRSPAQIQLSTSPGTHGREELQLDVSLGTVASAIQSKHLQGILCLLEHIAAYRSKSRFPPPSKPADPSPPGPDIHVTASTRGIVLLLPLGSSAPTSGGYTVPDLSPFYERPLVPPVLSCGYFRLYIDTVQASVSRISDVIFGKSRSDAKIAASFNTQITSEISIGDVSLFQVAKHVSSSPDEPELHASPVLIVDPHLPGQYSSSHYHPMGWGQCYDLPTFEVLDWTRSDYQVHGVKLSPWRTRGKVHHTDATQRTTHSEQQSSPAITVSIATTISSSPRKNRMDTSVDVQMSPLHVFLDLGSLLKAQVLAFLGEVMEDRNLSPSSPSSPDTDDVNPFDFGDKRPPQSQAEPEVRFSLGVRAVRIQARVPPPTLANPRSGALILDLDDVTVTNHPSTRSQRARFAELGSFPPSGEEAMEEHVLTIDFSRVVVACSAPREPVASSLLSVGSLAQKQDTAPGLEEDTELLKPRLRILRQVVSHGSAHNFCLDVPSVYVDIWKSAFDNVQYWIDDASQLFDRTFNPNTAQHLNLQSDDLEANLVGSRFFAKSRDNSVSSSTVSEELDKIIKLAVSEVFIRAKVPRIPSGELRVFLVSASDLQVSVGTRPEDISDETGIKVQISDLAIQMSDPTSTQHLFSMTSPHTVSSPSRPVLSLRFSSISLPGSSLKESIVKAALSGFTLSLNPDFSLVEDLAAFVKSPPNTFETVIPSERTRVALQVYDGSVQLFANSHPGSFVAYLDGLDLKTDITGIATESEIHIGLANLSVLLIDDLVTMSSDEASRTSSGVSHWKRAGFAPVGEVTDLLTTLKFTKGGKSMRVIVDDVCLRITLCADTADALNAFLDDFSTSLQPAEEQRSQAKPDPTPVVSSMTGSGLMGSIDDLAFRKIPEIGPAPDMIEDDLPTNPNYLDESFGAAAGLRELRDEDFDDFGDEDELRVESYAPSDGPGVISRIGGETIRMIRPEGIEVVDNFFLTLPPEPEEGVAVMDDTVFSLRLKKGDITLALYDGYDWFRTRKTIEDQAKAVRKRLTKIRQLVASGQAYSPSSEETGALLFNSVYVGLEDMDEMDQGAILAAIDEELKEDPETASQSSWQTLRPAGIEKQPRNQAAPKRRKLVRSRGPSMEFKFMGAKAEFDKYGAGASLVNRTLVTIRDVEILDHIKTSTWKKFLTELRSDSQGNIRETGSNMVRVELRTIRPVANDLSEEARLRAKILPLRLYVDQDAVDFLKKFFSFKNLDSLEPEPELDRTPKGTYFQLAEVFPVDLKLDYKPRRVDYKALREGRTIELMNFFHFDGAEMTLRHITLSGITGWARLFELLNDLWTPDVKATQLAEVISGVAPIRSVVNVGSGMADLVLLPIAQYRKDGRIVRGVQKGATAFMKSTAMEAIKLGSRLATGTQVILEQAEGVLGNQFDQTLTAETVGGSFQELLSEDSDEEDIPGISKYAQQPADVKEGVQFAYRSLRKNLSSAAQTILAIPMEVYERSGNEGAVRSVIRAVPIAVLRPMIGASEAVSKTLQGLHNTLDPEVRQENEAKYKQR